MPDERRRAYAVSSIRTDLLQDGVESTADVASNLLLTLSFAVDTIRGRRAVPTGWFVLSCALGYKPGRRVAV